MELTLGQQWLTERKAQGKTSYMTPKDIKAYVAAGGKIISYYVKPEGYGYDVTSTLYYTESYTDACVSYDLGYKTITKMINNGELFPYNDPRAEQHETYWEK